MNKQIRDGVFMRSSASSHCIMVTKCDRILTPEDIVTDYRDYAAAGDKELFYINEKGEWDIGEEICFSSRFQVISSLEDKALYAIAEYCGNGAECSDAEKGIKLDEIHKILYSVVPDMIDINLPVEYTEVFLDQAGNELQPEDIHTNDTVSIWSAMRHYYKRDGKIHPAKYADYAYEIPKIPGIDPKSAGLLPLFLEAEGITLREFLLNRKYLIIVTPEEEDSISKLKRSGLLCLNNIVKEYTIWQAYEAKKQHTPSSEGA